MSDKDVLRERLAAIAADLRKLAKALDAYTGRVYVAVDPTTEEPADLFDKMLDIADRVDQLRLPITAITPSTDGGERAR
jgi:hypothetical protein